MKTPILKSKTNRPVLWLFIFSGYCLSLLMFRIWITGSYFYLFLVWNLFLAYIPFGITYAVKQYQSRYFYGLFLVWLAFLPNAPYILTDIFHLNKQNNMPQWFDLLIVLSFALNGVLLFFISLNAMYSSLRLRFSKIKTDGMMVVILFLSAFGIYIGRFLRWNTWDVVANPLQLFRSVTEIFLYPSRHPRAWGFTLGYGILLLFIFQFLRIFFPDTKKTKL